MTYRSIFLLLMITLLFISCKEIEETKQKPLFNQASINVDDNDGPLQIVAFGSCNDEDNDHQPIWKYVVENQADLWIWLGDIIYGDSNNPKVLQKKYIEQKTNKDYQLLYNAVPIIGVWDDHDYGVNDGDKHFAIKGESKELLMDFLDVPTDQPVRSREGAYQSYSYGPTGQKVKIILLDTRYFRDKLIKNPAIGGQRYLASKTGDILGASQWDWLEKELTNSDAQLHIIATGIQLVAEDHNYEKWANFPLSRKRFVDLINKTKPTRPVVISGDRHLAEVSSMTLDSLSHPLYDITSSGLTHSYEKVDMKGETNHHRVNHIITGQKNFAQLYIDWDSDPIKVKVEIRGLGNRVLHQLDLDLE